MVQIHPVRWRPKRDNLVALPTTSPDEPGRLVEMTGSDYPQVVVRPQVKEERTEMKPIPLSIGPASVEGRHTAVEAYKNLLKALDSAHYVPGSRLPGERALAAQLGVSRATLRLVLKALADTGRIDPSPQRGWFVAERKFIHEPNRLRSFSEAAAEQGMKASSKMIRLARRPATVDEAEALSLADGDDVVHLERVRSLDNGVISVDSSCLPAHRVPGLELADLTDTSLYGLLMERYGIIPMRCDYQLQAELATSRIAGLLEMPEGAPVLVGYQTTFDQSESRVDVGWQVYRGDSYRFRASLFRHES